MSGNPTALFVQVKLQSQSPLPKILFLSKWAAYPIMPTADLTGHISTPLV
jgi:hypothetical protein